MSSTPPSLPELAAQFQVALGLALRDRRERAGLTQRTLARRAGIGARHLRGVETGRRGVSYLTLWALADELGVPLSALVAEADRTVPKG